MSEEVTIPEGLHAAVTEYFATHEHPAIDFRLTLGYLGTHMDQPDEFGRVYAIPAEDVVGKLHTRGGIKFEMGLAEIGREYGVNLLLPQQLYAPVEKE